MDDGNNMIIYVLILFSFIYLAYKYDYLHQTRNKILWYKLSCLILILLAGLRNHVGGDTFNYISKFEEWPNLKELFYYKYSLSELTQPLWFLINSTLKTIIPDFTIVQIFHAVVSNILLFRFFKYTTPCLFSAILCSYCIYWWNFNFEILRESLCVALYLNALLELNKGKIWKYIIICLPALFIHYFSFIIIAITLIIHYIPKKHVILLSILCSSIFLFLNPGMISSIIGGFLTITNPELLPTVENYLINDSYGFHQLNIFGIILQFIILLPTILLIKAYYKDSNKQFLVKLLCLYGVIIIFIAKILILARLQNYLLPVFVITVLNYLNENIHKKRYAYYIVFLVFTYYTISYINDFYQPPANSNLKYDCRYIPYKSIFQEEDKLRTFYYSVD